MEMKMLSAGVLLLFLSLTGTKAQLDVCGQAPLNTRIVGGVDAVPGAWPWQASVQRRNNHFCGAFLINNEWLLSAAHCFTSDITADLSLLDIYLGRQVQQGSNPNEVSRSVAQIINHPNYSNTNGDNDISLVRLSQTVSFTNFIRPTCLAASGSTLDSGAVVWVTGWGRINVGDDLPAPQTLQEVNVSIASNVNCNEAYNGVITDNMICAGSSEGGRDSCQGDSGGPMVYKNGTTWVAAGAVSFGRDCGLAEFPGVYARVSRYESWIKSHITTNQPGFVNIRATGTNLTSSSSRGTPHLLFLILPVLLSLPHLLSTDE